MSFSDHDDFNSSDEFDGLSEELSEELLEEGPTVSEFLIEHRKGREKPIVTSLNICFPTLDYFHLCKGLDFEPIYADIEEHLEKRGYKGINITDVILENEDIPDKNNIDLHVESNL